LKCHAFFQTVPRAGEVENGDAALHRVDGDITMLAVIDALGHGTRAAEVTATATRVLEESALSSGVATVFDRLHAELGGSRGACALVLLAQGDQIEVASVGNIELRASFRLPLVLTPGVLGSRVRSLKVCSATAVEGGRAFAYSDGISGRFQLTDYTQHSTEEACRAIFERQRRDHDDATLLVAEFQR
jgi:phosphoserine phosphatase RsbX